MFQAWFDYAIDATQRSVLFWDTLRLRGNAFIEHAKAGQPALVKFPHEMVLDGRDLDPPANYALLRILPPADAPPTDPRKRPFVVVDPRAGHGPGIGGFKPDSEIGFSLRAGHPTYFVTFFPEPAPGQRLVDVARAEARFLEAVRDRHREAIGGPCVVGNCQAGWAIMALAALRPELPGLLLLAGAPLSYWAGEGLENPMRYTGGVLGGSWLAHLACDLGNGRFDGANLVLNFESLNPDTTWWGKYWTLYDKADTEPPRFLDFERWWGGYFLMTREEFTAIVDELFVGNRLARGEVTAPGSAGPLDLRRVRAPICILASWGDDITPPAQALSWILDLYAGDDDILVQGQTIVYCLHKTIGHLGIFVSGSVAQKEHASFIGLVDLIETLPPGLFEMVIEDRNPEAPGAALIPGRWHTRFERRTIADVEAICGDRGDERAFEVVRRVSEANRDLYTLLVAPAVRALASEPAAAAARALHPLRAQRWALSDLNPLLWPLSGLAPMVAEHRRPCAPDNPFRVAERMAADSVAHSLRAMAEARDRAAHAIFEASYATPLARAAVGLAGAPPPRPLGADPARRALAEREAAELRAAAGDGTVLDGIVRLLLLAIEHAGGMDEVTFRALRALAEELPPEQRVPPARAREAARRQALLLRLDRRAAVEGLGRIFVTEDARRLAWSVVRRIVATQLDPAEAPAAMAKLVPLIGPPPGEAEAAPRPRARRGTVTEASAVPEA